MSFTVTRERNWPRFHFGRVRYRGGAEPYPARSRRVYLRSIGVVGVPRLGRCGQLRPAGQRRFIRLAIVHRGQADGPRHRVRTRLTIGRRCRTVGGKTVGDRHRRHCRHCHDRFPVHNVWTDAITVVALRAVHAWDLPLGTGHCCDTSAVFFSTRWLQNCRLSAPLSPYHARVIRLCVIVTWSMPDRSLSALNTASNRRIS